MSREGDRPESPPVLGRMARGSAAPTPSPAPRVGLAPAVVAPPPGTRVTADAAIAASLSWTGDLATDSALRLYYLAAAALATGRLTLDGTSRYVLYLKRGTPEHATSDDPADDLGAFLVSKGVVAADRLASAEAARAKLGGDLVTALAALGVLNPAESFRVLQEHAVGTLSRALTLQEGSARWEPSVGSPPSAFPLGSRFALLCDAVRRLDALAVRQRLGPRANRVALRAGGRISIADLKLTALEARAASFFDQVHSPAELAAAHPAEATSLLRVTMLLAETELLSFGADRPPVPLPQPASTGDTPAPAAAVQPARAASSPAAPTSGTEPGEPKGAPGAEPASSPRERPSATPVPARPALEETKRAPAPSAAPARVPVAAAAAAPPPMLSVEQLRALLARMHEGDHFAALGVGRDAPAARIKVAYFQLAKQYHPDASQPGESPEQRQLRADVFARVSEAWRVLSDDARRAAYLDELANGGAPSVDIAALLEAEQIFQQATIFVRTRQYAAALDAIDRAAKLNPAEAEFDVWRAWVLFLVDDEKTKRRASSEKAIEAALKVNPRCLPGYLFLGQMAKLTGDAAAAQKHLKRGLAIDGENPDLLRELKHLRK